MQLSHCTKSRDPGRAGGGWLCLFCPRRASLARCRKPGAVAQRGFPVLPAPADAPASRARSQGTLPFAATVLHYGARSTSAPSSRDRPREKEPAPGSWALRPARGAGWRARRCWPSLCGSAWRPGLPQWVRSPLPRRKAERSGAGGEMGGMRRGPGGRILLGIRELER